MIHHTVNAAAAFPVHVALPEPPASRAQSIPGSILQQWLRGVIQRDLDGYAVISGGGHTVTVIYGDGHTLGAVVTRGDTADTDEIFVRIERQPDSDCFVLTCKLPVKAGRIIAGLLNPPVSCVTLALDGSPVLSSLAAHVPAGFDGAIVVQAADISWYVLLLASGDLLASYGADDRSLSMTPGSVSVLSHLEQLHVAVHPAVGGSDRAGAGERLRGPDMVTPEVESRMIELLSLFEHRLSTLDRSSDVAARLAAVLAEVCDAASDLDQSQDGMQSTDIPRHPVLSAHWDQARGRVLTRQLIDTFEMAAIPDAWVTACDALLLAIDREVELRLTWLAVDDELGAATLREALDDLLQQSRRLLKEWRAQRMLEARARQPADLVLSP